MQEAQTIPEKLLNSEETGELLGRSESTVQRLVRAGALPVVRLPRSRHFRFRPAAVAAFIQSCEGLTFDGGPGRVAA